MFHDNPGESVPLQSHYTPINYNQSGYSLLILTTKTASSLFKCKSSLTTTFPVFIHDSIITSRLRSANKFPLIFAKTIKFKNSFICYRLPHYQLRDTLIFLSVIIYRWGIKMRDFLPISRYISQTIQDIAMVAMEGE